MLVDGLVASAAPDVLVPAAGRLRLVVLVHMPLGATGPTRRTRRAVLAAARRASPRAGGPADRLLERYAPAPERVHVAEPGVDPAGLAPGTRVGRRLLCVAAVTPAKGHDVLLARWRRCADLPWRCTLRRLARPRPGLRRAAAAAR